MVKIIKKECLNPTVTKLVVEHEKIAKKAKAGQFIILRVDSEGERIPLTIADTNPLENTVTITVKSQAGEEKKYQITIKKVDDTTTVQDVITDSSMIINNNTLTKIKNNTKLETLKNTLIKAGAKSIIIKDVNGKDIENTNTLIGTGQTITINTALETQTFTISVNGDTSTGAYISNAEGKKDSNQNLSNHIGQNFYIAIPKSKVNGNNITITFDGSYKTNEKKLLVSTTKTEQPVVEVTPKNEPFELIVNAPLQKEFDLALRKAITKITSADGKTKNEKGANAERKVTVDTTTIPNTATYKHRKDPVEVKDGDIVLFRFNV